MPHTVAELEVSQHVEQAYVLTIDGISIGFTTDDSAALTGSGGSSFIGRAEADLGETVGGRELRRGLIVPQELELGGDLSYIGLDRTTARFSVLDEDGEIARLFSMSGEEPEELTSRLAPYTSPAPATIDGVTVRDRHIGIERIGPNGERRMFPYLVGEDLVGLDHNGDSDGALVPASVSQRPLFHEGRPVALYRVYRDPSAQFTTGSNAWPSLSNYRPIWVGKLRDAGRVGAEGRFELECTGPESLLERVIGVPRGESFEVVTDLSFTPGVDDQISIYCATIPGWQNTGDNASIPSDPRQGRQWTSLTQTSYLSLRNEIHDLVQDTVNGVGTDYELGETTLALDRGGDAGFSGSDFYVQMDLYSTGEIYGHRIRIAMHRRTWLALGFDPIQQSHNGQLLITEIEDEQDIVFWKAPPAGQPYFPTESNIAGQMGVVPGNDYWVGMFTTIPPGYNPYDIAESEVTTGEHDNGGSPRLHRPLYDTDSLPNTIQPNGGQVIRIPAGSSPPLYNQPHVPRSGSIGGASTTAAGYFLIKGKIRKIVDESTSGQLEIEESEDYGIVARCSWIEVEDYFAQAFTSVSPQLYIEQIHDARDFGYPYRPFQGEWASTTLTAQQIFTTALGTAITRADRVDQQLSSILRSTGGSTGPNGAGIIQQGGNQGTATGFFGDIYAAHMGLAVPSYLMPSQSEIAASVNEALPSGIAGSLARGRFSTEEPVDSRTLMEGLLAPRGLRIGFDGGRFSIYRLPDPGTPTVDIFESDLYGKMGDPASAIPEQQSRAIAPVDAWVFRQSEDHRIGARDPGAALRRGGNVEDVETLALLDPELYASHPTERPDAAGWRLEARNLFGDTLARFYARRHNKVTVTVSRPKASQLYPGTSVRLSNPWPVAADGTRGLSGVVGRVLRVRHKTGNGAAEVEILVYEGQDRPLPVYAPALWISAVSGLNLTIDTSAEVDQRVNSTVGWTQPSWSSAGSGDAVAALWRELPDRTWGLVGTAPVASVSSSTVTLRSSLSASPPDLARTMLLTLSTWSDQPEWAQELYAGLTIQGDNTGGRRFS